MSKSTNMLRTRRRDNNVKPNRRLDRKSSRGMIYENEELRLRTININAEIERGQYDIKKLKRENEMLKKEIWSLRDEYDKLDKLLKDKEYDFSSSSTTCSSESESCSSCTEESEEVETSQNLQNVQKTNMKNLHTEFDHLSVVPEENSTENSDKNSNRASIPNDWNLDNNIIKPDQSYPPYEKASTLPAIPPKNFFSPIKMCKSDEEFYVSEKVVTTNAKNLHQHMVLGPKMEEVPAIGKSATDLIVKTDNCPFTNGTSSRSTFSNGGNLEELLNDIETISQDILKITNDQVNVESAQPEKPFKSELNVVLMPNPMPLLGFDKYRNIQNSFDSLHSKSAEQLPPQEDTITVPPLTSPPPTSTNCEHNPFYFGPVSDTNSDFFNNRYNPDNLNKTPNESKTNLMELTSSELISSENEENLKFQTSKLEPPKADKSEDENKKTPKLSIRRKVSIHFKGKRDKSLKQNDKKLSIFDIKFGEPKHQKTPSLESKKSTTDAEPKTPTSSDSKTGSERKKSDEKKQRKSVSVSPDRKHVHVKDDKKHKKHRKSERIKSRRGTITSVDRFHRERSFSVCTERSNVLDHKYGGYEDSDRERTNSLSSCETVKTRKMSNISNIPLNGKVPWCGCWGNGCI